MHILMTADTVGGVWTYTRELASGLISRGHRVTLASFGRYPTAAQTEWLHDLARIDFHPTNFRLEWMQDAAADLQASEVFLQNIISRTQPDLLHLNQYCYGQIRSPVPRVVVAHSDVLSWWTTVHGQPAPANDWISFYRGVVSSGLAGADAVIAPSQWMLDALRHHYLFDAPSGVIHNGRSVTLFDPNRRKRECILTVGRLWDDAKQVSLILQARHSLPVCVVGQQQCNEAKFKEALRFANHSDCELRGEHSESELRDLYAQCSTYAATSKYEPFGLAPLEAALSRCALIANDIPSFRELWNGAALFFARNDASSLADAITQFASQPKLREEYADRAYKHACTHFTAGSMLDGYEQLYRDVLGGRADA